MGGDLGVKGKKENRKDARKIFEMVDESELEDTAIYMIREELQRKKMRIKEERKVWGFEERRKVGEVNWQGSVGGS